MFPDNSVRCARCCVAAIAFFVRLVLPDHYWNPESLVARSSVSAQLLPRFVLQNIMKGSTHHQQSNDPLGIENHSDYSIELCYIVIGWCNRIEKAKKVTMKHTPSNSLLGRARTVGVLFFLLASAVQSFQVPAFVRKPLVSSPRVLVVVPTKSLDKSNKKTTTVSWPLSSTTNNKDDEDQKDTSNENSLYQPQPGERIDSNEPVVQVNFDDMFQGMPKMEEILDSPTEVDTSADPDDHLAASAPEETSTESTVNPTASTSGDDAWFAPIQQEIQKKYEGIKQKMEQELQEQRQADPESVPDNADLLMETVWQLELEEELEAEREKAAKELLEDYQKQGMKDTETRDLSGTEDSQVAQKLQEELKQEQEEQAAQQARLDDFLRYEQESFQKAAQNEVAGPDAGGDLDKWALERLEDMLSSTPEEDLEVADNLQANIEELRSKIEKEQQRGSIRPETLKEWQMYRAIATRMLEDEAEGGNTAKDSEPVEDEEAIAGQLESWKTFQEKERSNRRKSGLSRGPKMPFEWHEAPRSQSTIDVPAPPPTDDKRSRKEIRADVNQKSIEVLEGLLESSLGTPREASLRQNLEDLKAGLEEDLALEDEEDLADSDAASGPVDISDVFVRVDETKTPTVPKSTTEEPAVVSPPSTPFFSADDNDDNPVIDRTPPNTAFFSDIDDDIRDTGSTSVKRPNTPFFSDDEDDADIEMEELDSSKLGTMEEQQLQRMYRRAGAVTAEEQEKIRAEWEQFQNIEKQKRDISGLSDESSTLGEVDLKYNIDEVMKDGDIDAEKILSSIGPRPTRKRKRDRDAAVETTSSATSSTTGSPSTTADSLDDNKDVKGDETLDTLDPLFRSISAVGGGRTKDDPEAKAKEKSAFEEFVMKQAEVRDTIDKIDSSLVNKTLDEALDELGFEQTEISSETLDDKGYTDEVLDSVGARPKRERRLSPAEYERVYSDNGGVSSDEDDDDSEPVSDDDDLVPPWMKKAKDGLDRGVGATLDDQEEHERNMQQLREYEERRAPKRQRQMGIDLSDVFGRDMAADNDYDYGQTSLGWEQGRSFSGFESRKANLLDYKELDVRELNLLMDTKDSVQTTGVSQYIPRINKPFRDFGAIFRMEGVLLDTTGFEYEAWTETAKKLGYKLPLVEDVRLAAVTRPEIAARKIFFWTDDFLTCKQIARTHQDSMKDIFAKWMKEKSITYVEPAPVEVQEKETSTAMRTPVVAATSDADTDKQFAAWARTAEKYGFTPPSLDEVLFASVVSADDAVMNSFRWTSDASKVSDIVTTFKGFVANGAEPEETASQSVIPTSSVADPMQSAWTAPDTPRPCDTLTENDMLEIQYKAWLAVAEEHDLYAPTTDEALGAMVINDPVLVVRDGFAWSDDPKLIGELVREYEESVRGQVRKLTGATKTEQDAFSPSSGAPSQEKTSEEEPKRSGPTEEEVTEMKAYAWMTAAEEHGCDEPMIDDFRAALYTDPEYAVKKVYRWTDDDEKAKAVAATYQKELDEMSKEYIEKHNLDVVPTRTVPQLPKLEKPKGPSSGELFQAAFDAWKQVAERRGFPPPTQDQVQFSMAVGPDDGLLSFRWTDDADERKKIVEEYLSAVRQTSAKLESFDLGLTPKPQSTSPRDDKSAPYTVIPGASRWLDRLQDVEMPCGLISFLEREQVDVLLDQSGLSRYFPVDKRVTQNNGYELEGQQMLGAALRVERRPDHCVVFDSSPESSVAAHDMDMKSVSLVGAYPMYELLNADTTARYLDELTAMNIRRLFGERVYDQPLIDSKEDRPDLSKPTKTLTRFWEEGDRE